jgi:hypothetical protein
MLFIIEGEKKVYMVLIHEDKVAEILKTAGVWTTTKSAYVFPIDKDVFEVVKKLRVENKDWEDVLINEAISDLRNGKVKSIMTDNLNNVIYYLNMTNPRWYQIVSGQKLINELTTIVHKIYEDISGMIEEVSKYDPTQLPRIFRSSNENDKQIKKAIPTNQVTLWDSLG